MQIVAKAIINIDNNNYIVLKYSNDTYEVMSEYEFHQKFPSEQFGDYSSGSISDSTINRLASQYNTPPKPDIFERIKGCFFGFVVFIILFYVIFFVLFK